MLKSTTEFVDLLEGQSTAGDLYSLDVESLFTNVPVNRTINIICDKVYNHPNLPPPPSPRNVLKKLLLIFLTLWNIFRIMDKLGKRNHSRQDCYFY